MAKATMFRIAFLSFLFLVPLQTHASDLKDFQNFKEKGLLDISKLAIDMSNFGALTAVSPIKGKLTELTVKVEEAEQEIEAAEESDREKELEGNIGTILNGLETLATGIHSGSWQNLALGGLDVTIPLATMADINDPLTAIILSLVSTVFDVFGGSTGGEINTESMIQRIIDFALDRANSTQLDLDASSTKRLYSSLSNNIIQLRDGGNINKEQATDFFNQAFEEMAIFGKVEGIITSSCSIGDITKYDDDTELDYETEKCLEFLNLICSLNVIRQLLIMDMASLVAEAGLNNTATYLLRLIRKKQEINKHILRFMVDPINFRSERYALSHFYGSPEKWPVLKAYIHRLDVMSNGKYLRAHAMVCAKQQLQGECYQMYIGKYSAAQLMSWRSTISSIYIGGNLRVTGFDEDNFTGAKYGPFIGPTVIGTVPGRNEWESLEILATKKDAREYLRICEGQGLEQTAPCDVLPLGQYNRLDKINYTNWSQRINSISIPLNMEVTGFDDFNFKGNKFGPFQGPDTIEKMCHGGQWKSMKLEPASKKISQMIRVCREENFGGYCDLLDEEEIPELTEVHGCSWNEVDTKIKSMRIPGGLKVYLWTEKNYKGLSLGPYTGPSLVPLVDGAESQHVIRSIKIKRLY